MEFSFHKDEVLGNYLLEKGSLEGNSTTRSSGSVLKDWFQNRKWQLQKSILSENCKHDRLPLVKEMPLICFFIAALMNFKQYFYRACKVYFPVHLLSQNVHTYFESLILCLLSSNLKLYFLLSILDMPVRQHYYEGQPW